MSEHLETNRAWWDENVSFHAESGFYDVEAFKAGKLTFRPACRVEFLHEFPYACYRMLRFLKQDRGGWWRLTSKLGSNPMTFSLKAYNGCRKPGTHGF